MVKRDLIKQLILWFLLVAGLVGLRVYVFDVLTITEQMANRYLNKNDTVVVAKQAELTHGDFVLYKVEKEAYVGRIIALPGEQVTYMDDVLYRNDAIIAEDYLRRTQQQEAYTEDLTVDSLTDGRHQKLPKKHFLVLNDNRTDQADSRTFGLISRKQIVGQLAFRISPLDQFGFVQTGLTP